MADPVPFAQFHEAPWGRWDLLRREAYFQVKRVAVKPGNRLSYQTHSKRSEHWVVVRGQGLAVLNDKEVSLLPGESLDVPVGVAHRMGNPGKEELVFIEVQLGSYFGEDDIVRIQDDHGRTR